MAIKKVYSSAFKAQVVQEVLTEEKPLTQIASERGVHPRIVREWKALVLRELPTLFDRQTSVATLKADYERQMEDLYAEIGRLTTHITWLKKAQSKPTQALIADELSEQEFGSHHRIQRIVEAMGEEAALALLAEVQQIEANGGMMISDGSRRRTPGGVFFHLARQRLTPEKRQTAYDNKKRTGSGRSATPPSWTNRGMWIGEVRGKPKGVNTVKITLVGKLGRTVEKQGFALAMLRHNDTSRRARGCSQGGVFHICTPRRCSRVGRLCSRGEKTGHQLLKG